MTFYFPWEMRVLEWLNVHRTPALNLIMRFITFLGDKGWFWIALTILLLILKKQRDTGFTMALSLLLCFLSGNLLLKPLIARVRPYELNTALVLIGPRMRDFSFPSGHALASFGAAWALFRNRPRAGIPCLILAALISFSRLYLSVHYPTDVLAGMLLGIFIGEAAFRIVRASHLIHERKASS